MEFEWFGEPVYVFVGLGLLTPIQTVSRAYIFLIDMPARRRGAAHSVALHACWAALRKEADAETVRGTFLKYVEEVGILAPDSEPLLPGHQVKGGAVGVPL